MDTVKEIIINLCILTIFLFFLVLFLTMDIDFLKLY